MKRILLCAVLIFAAFCQAQTVYVNNVKGDDKNDGSKDKPVASIWQALKMVKKSGVIDVANTGKRRLSKSLFDRCYDTICFSLHLLTIFT